MSGNATDPVVDDLTAALSAWRVAIARADAAFSHGATEEFEWAEAVSALDAARRLASCADAVRAYLAEAEKNGRAEGAIAALRAYANVIEGGPRLTRSDEIADIRDVAGRIESGEVTL